MVATYEQDRQADQGLPAHQPWFQQLVESLPQLVWASTSDGSCDYLTERWADYSGVPTAGLLGFGWQALIHPEDRDGLHTAWSAAGAAGVPFGAEIRLRRHDGTYRWFDVRVAPVCGPSGQVQRWLGSNTDSEDRRLARARQDESDERLSTVLDSMSEGLMVGDLDGEIRSWNRAGLDMHGYPSLGEGLRGVAEFAETFELRTLEGAVLSSAEWPLSRIVRGEAVQDEAVRLYRRDAQWDRVLSYTGSQRHEPGEPTQVFVTITDLTDRYEAIDARLDSEERLRLANEAAAIGTYDIDFSVGHIRYSPEMCALLGVDGATEHPLDESLGFVHPDDAEDFDRLFAAARDPAGTGTARGEHRFVHSSGEVRWAAWSARTSFGSTPDGRRPVRTVGAYVDITEPRRAERRLATQNAVSRSLIDVVVTGEAVPEIIRSLCESEGWDLGAYWEVDPGSDVLRCADLWHRDDAVFSPFIDATRALTFIRGEGLPGRVWSTAAPIMIEDVGRDPSYERAQVALEAGLRSAVAFPIVVHGEISGVLDFVGRGMAGRGGEPLEMLGAIGRQLGLYFERRRADTERQELESQLRQSQRMEAIGALSGGIAHDFNNILSAIVGNVELALEDVGEGHAAVQSLSAIGQASQHARELVQQILTFAQQGRVERRVVSLASVAAESVRLLRATVPAGVELTLQCDPGCPHVLADVTQIQQVIVNLGTNAWHALQAHTGCVEVSLAAVTVDEAKARRLPGLRAGSCALLTVRDTGTGIEASTLERIFDPFFTTKTHGSGTGLGLSVVHGIVQRHEGAILVSSVPGRGTSFEIYLPAAEGRAAEARDWKPRASVRGHGEHILFIDDQEALVALADRMLPRLGYRVSGFVDATVAVEAFGADPDGFAVVVTDMNMPHLSGLEVTAEVQKLRPDIPVVLLSGYVAPDLLEQAQRQGLREVVSKPVDMRALGEALHRALHPPAD